MKLTIVLGIMTALLAGPLAPSGEQATEDDRASKIKAGMLLNFIRYTEWPDQAFASGESPIIITVLGEGEMNSLLAQTVLGQRVRGRAMEVRRLDYPKSLRGESSASEDRLREFQRQLRASHLLFLCDSERDRLETVLRHLDRSNVLTVSDMDEFCERGGMLGLAIRGGRVAFDANPDEIQETQLKVSSQLLRLARIVKSRGQ